MSGQFMIVEGTRATWQSSKDAEAQTLYHAHCGSCDCEFMIVEMHFPPSFCPACGIRFIAGGRAET